MKCILLAISLLFMPTLSISSESINYCHNPDVNAEWAKMLSEAPKDNLVVQLFALRIGLCELVKRKVIDTDRAIDIFEKARGQAVDERKRYEMRQKYKDGGNS